MVVRDNLNMCLLQYNICWENKYKNYARIQDLLKGVTLPPDFIVLPEMFSTGFSNNAADCSENMQGPTIDWMFRISKEFNCLLAGSIIISENNHYYNRYIAVHNDTIISVYDKRHLFRMEEENIFYKSGTEKSTMIYKGWRIAPFICYDLRFPVWMRNRDQYDLAVIVANWPSKRDDVWQILLKARALENLSFVAGVNRTGIDGKDIDYAGNSAIVHPGGRFLNTLTAKDGIIEVQLSMSELITFRDKFPAHLDADNFNITGP